MRRLLCYFGWHNWFITQSSWRGLALAHLHTLAGNRAICQRCSKIWDDLPYGRMVHPVTKEIVNTPEEL